jgi:hypothetical protein
MSRRFSLPACLTLLYGLVALGPTTAEAAGIGVHLRGHAQNIPRAVAGDTTRISRESGRAGPSRLNSNTRSIQLDTAGETTTTRSPK